MATAKPQAALRPMLPTDVPDLAAIFRASIAELAQEDYNEDQLDAWAARADDEASFGKDLAGALVLIATIGGQAVGFAALQGADRIGMLYVSPDFARVGVGTLLCDALEKLAGARGAAKLTVDASDTAREFFLVRGFVPMVRNMVPVEGEWLGNTTMERKLSSSETPPL